MLRQVTPHVYCWSEIHGAARNEPYPWNSYLIDVPNDDVVDVSRSAANILRWRARD